MMAKSFQKRFRKKEITCLAMILDTTLQWCNIVVISKYLYHQDCKAVLGDHSYLSTCSLVGKKGSDGQPDPILATCLSAQLCYNDSAVSCGAQEIAEDLRVEFPYLVLCPGCPYQSIRICSSIITRESTSRLFRVFRRERGNRMWWQPRLPSPPKPELECLPPPRNTAFPRQ